MQLGSLLYLTINMLEALSATHVFQAIVSADDVHRGKPDPEVYLTAARARWSVEGSRRAGMRSIGVSHTGKHCWLMSLFSLLSYSIQTHSKSCWKAVLQRRDM